MTMKILFLSLLLFDVINFKLIFFPYKHKMTNARHLKKCINLL